MGATTNYDLPYPELSDAANVPQDVRALAEATEAALLGGSLVQSGSATVDIVTVNVAVAMDVNFPVPYPVGVVPNVVVSSAQAVPHQRFISAYSADNTKFTVTGVNTASSADVIFTWIARGDAA